MKSLGLFAVLLPSVASAQTVNVTLNTPALQFLGANQITLIEQQLEAEFTQQAQALVGDADIGSYLNLGANAQSLVSKGIGTDYASAPDGFIVGVSASAAVTGGSDALNITSGGLDDSVPVGVGGQLSIMVGYNFAGFDLPELTVFVHAGGAPVSLSSFEGSFYNFGANAQYRFIGPRGSSLIGWGGLAVTSGIEVSRMKLSLVQDDVAFDTTVEGVRIQSDSSGSLSLVQRSVSVPIELTTSMRALHFLSLFGGVAMDLNFGSADLVLDVDTTITADGQQGLGSATASLEDSGDPDRVAFRLLGGAQIDTGPVHWFGQVNLLPKDISVSVVGGARVTF